MRDQIIELVTRHCQTLRSEAAEIEAIIVASGVEPGPDRATLVAKVHKLKGSSGTIGFPDVSGRAETIEKTLRGAQERPLTAAERDSLLAEHRALQEGIARISPEQSTLYAHFAQVTNP